MFDYHHSCVSVGLAHGEKMIAGFVYHPYIDEMYVGIKGKGSNTVYLELKLQPYDYAAASVILEEAGGKITQINGEVITFHQGCSVIGGTPAAWRESREAFERLKEVK